MATKLLLIEDVESLGRSGDIVTVKPGFARNYLLPQGMAVNADKRALRRQDRLKEERQKKAEEDKKESEAIAAKMTGLSLTTIVKVDHDGHMYGSVTPLEIAHLLQDQHQIAVDKKAIQLKAPIKATGVYEIPVKLQEGVSVSFHLKVMSEEGFRASQEEQKNQAAAE